MNEEQQVQEVVSEQNEVKVDTQPQGTKEAEKQFSKDDVNNIVAKRVDKLNKQWQEKFDALQESIKLQSMDEQQKAEYQAQKEREAFEEERKQFYAERDKFNQEKYRSTIEQQLQSKGLPTDMAELLVTLSAEEVSAKIASMEQSFNKQVNSSIEAKVKASASTPVTPTTEQQALLSMEQIKAMSTQEILQNKELVDKSLDAIYGQK